MPSIYYISWLTCFKPFRWIVSATFDKFHKDCKSFVLLLLLLLLPWSALALLTCIVAPRAMCCLDVVYPTHSLPCVPMRLLVSVQLLRCKLISTASWWWRSAQLVVLSCSCKLKENNWPYRVPLWFWPLLLLLLLSLLFQPQDKTKMISLKAASSSSIRPTVADKVTTLVACHLTHAAAPPSPSPILAVTTFAASCPSLLSAACCLTPSYPFRCGCRCIRVYLLEFIIITLPYGKIFNVWPWAGAGWRRSWRQRCQAGARIVELVVCVCVCVSMSSLFSTLGEIF